MFKPLKIGEFETRNNVFLAPLAGYTNYPFRRICQDFGAGLCYTEMVSAKGLKYGSENTKELLYTDEKEGLVATQIFGSEPDTMRLACEGEDLAKYKIVDINMGCPVPKIYKNGEGSALLENPRLAEKIVEECVKSGKTITVKFRIGVSKDKIVTEEFAKRMAGAGASLITIHGRTKDKMYSGEVDFKEIEKAKKDKYTQKGKCFNFFIVSNFWMLQRKLNVSAPLIRHCEERSDVAISNVSPKKTFI